MSFWNWLKGLFTKKEAASAPVASAPIVLDSSSYAKLFSTMQIRSGWSLRAETAADKVVAGMNRYKAVEKLTNVPWAMIGIIHLLEADCSWTHHLHNGDSLSARTVQVPKGRPVGGNPPFTWEESAFDALAYDNIKPPLQTIGQIFGALEKFNGTGYQKKGINTPYLWSGSQHYSSGKYVADGKYEAGAVSKQVGAAVVWKVLQNRSLV